MQLGDVKCSWCGQDLQPRRGGSPQRFCSAKHRSLFWSALRRWGERAIAAGTLTIAEVKNGAVGACTLPQCSDPPSPLPDIGRSHNASADAPLRFLVEVERSTVSWLVKLRFIRPEQWNDLTAILTALKRVGQPPSIWRSS